VRVLSAVHRLARLTAAIADDAAAAAAAAGSIVVEVGCVRTDRRLGCLSSLTRKLRTPGHLRVRRWHCGLHLEFVQA